jgi:hypothetical protein
VADSDTEYHHGQMNAATQVADFRFFASATKWFSLFAGALVLFLTLWFCTAVGFFSALVTAVIVLAIGISFLRNKSRPVH